jgi:hypothetical protein
MPVCRRDIKAAGVHGHQRRFGAFSPGLRRGGLPFDLLPRSVKSRGKAA